MHIVVVIIIVVSVITAAFAIHWHFNPPLAPRRPVDSEAADNNDDDADVGGGDGQGNRRSEDSENLRKRQLDFWFPDQPHYGINSLNQSSA